MKSLLPLSIAIVLSLSACGGRDVEIISSAPGAPSSPPTTSTRPPSPVRADGRVAGVTGSCPALTFSLSGLTITTTTSTIVSGGCGVIVNGVTAAATGPRQADGSIAATRVDVSPAELTGAMSAVQGSCPALTFTVAGTAVSMSAATTLNDLSCAQLVNGTMVNVEGYRQADGSLPALTISAARR